ncbi:XisI protein [Nostoc sp. UHCC 0702]|nr:XisI protein [Nostoc sp. UHCC 0702]
MNLITHRQIIQQILTEYPLLPYAYGQLERQLIIDQNANHYLLLTLGWENKQRVHGYLVHINIINDKSWIQRDGTQDGIANELVKAGIPKDQIVLGSEKHCCYQVINQCQAKIT